MLMITIKLPIERANQEVTVAGDPYQKVMTVGTSAVSSKNMAG